MLQPSVPKQETILVIADDQITIDLIVTMFTSTTSVLTALNGETGLVTANKSRPDLIVLNSRVPDTGGYGICARLKAMPETQDIPVIFLSADKQPEDELTALNLGAIDYISKPMVPKIIKTRINMHMSQKRYRDKLERMSAVDGLTSIPNRRRFDEYINQEWRRAVRNKYPLSLLMIDIDHFKSYNATYGHLKGDECLQTVTRKIGQYLRRPSDMVARYGGEEFSVVLPDTPSSSAFELGKRIWSGVGSMNIEHTGAPNVGHLTISIGIASTIPDRKQQLSQFIQTADQNLYKSKDEGRNRVTR